jgi:rhodanese-related sulfurtransferase
MIQLKRLFKPVKNMDSEEAKAFIENHEEGTFTILDVRQPGEYEKARIPGSKLVPLPQLRDASDELDPERATIVY